MKPPAAAAGLAFSLLLAAAAPAPTAQQLQAAERARAAELEAQEEAANRAAAARADEKRLTQAAAGALARLRETEASTEAASLRIAALARRQEDAASRLAARAAELAPLLPLIQRLSIYPAETLLAVPAEPEQAVRGVLVMGGIARRLEQDAASLRAEQAEVARLQRELDAQLPALAAAQVAQAAAAAALDEQIAHARQNRRGAEDDASAAARRAAEEAARADSLRAAIARIEADRREAEQRARKEAENATRRRHTAEAAAARARQAALARPAGPGLAPPGEAPSQVTAPVAGQVVRAFGDATEGGPSAGLAYQVAPGARVVSPCGGRAVFAAPFRSFGQLLIVDCGGGYHFVLSGFERLDVQVGQPVAAGGPVGVMPGWDPRASASRPLLYVELRRDGQAVNPASFLRAKG